MLHHSRRITAPLTQLPPRLDVRRPTAIIGGMRTRHLLTLTVLATFTALSAAVAYLLRDPLPHFLERRSSLAVIAESPPTLDRGYELRQVRLTATSGLAVELMLRRAVDEHFYELAVRPRTLMGRHVPGIGMNQVYEANSVPQLGHVREAMRDIASEAA